MKTIQQITEECLNQEPELKSILLSGFANISALAKKLKPSIEEKLLKDVNLISIIISLKRIKENHKLPSKKIFTTFPEIRIKSELIEVVYDLEKISDQIIKEYFFPLVLKEQNIFFTKGIREFTIIMPKSVYKKVKGELKPKKVIDNLDLIAISLPDYVVDIPGVYNKIFQIIAVHNITIIEMFSTYKELSLLFKTEDTTKAFQVLKQSLSKL